MGQRGFKNLHSSVKCDAKINKQTNVAWQVHCNVYLSQIINNCQVQRDLCRNLLLKIYIKFVYFNMVKKLDQVIKYLEDLYPYSLEGRIYQCCQKVICDIGVSSGVC